MVVKDIMDRYIVKLNDDTLQWDLYDTVRGDREFGSYTSRERAEKFARKKNAKNDAARLVGFEFVPYNGPNRTVINAPYRTPTGRKLENKPKGQCDPIRAENGKVVIEYV